MTLQNSLQKIRIPWVEHISRELASGEGVRVGFAEQLERFYELLEQTVTTGDTAWLDPILFDWGRAPTETNLEQGEYFVSFVINRMIGLTIEIARDRLNKTDALELLAAVIPIFSHSLSAVVRYEMETRVAHTSNELKKIQEKLQQLDHNKSNFISVAAHELKTPLTLIEGYTSMMVDVVEAANQPQMNGLLEGVNTGIQRLRQIIDDMIDVSMIDNNLLTLTVQPLTIAQLLNLLKIELANTIAARSQNFFVNKFAGSELIIYADTKRLYQAFLNVATNAIKFTPDHGTITIDGRMLPGFIEVLIKDRGIGISAENQTAIFEKFGQLGRTDLHSSGKTKFKGGGPGLGLPIARGIIEAHGGTIWVESEGYDEVKLNGSIFHLILPTRTEATDPIMTKFFGHIDQTKPESETKISAKENPPTDNPPS